MPKTKVLITVTTYPLPSRSYDELVCTAGLLEDGTWIRIYPVPFKFLEFKKYQWIELDLQRPRKKDFRPESFSPVKPDLSDLKVVSEIDTRYNCGNSEQVDHLIPRQSDHLKLTGKLWLDQYRVFG